MPVLSDVIAGLTVSLVSIPKTMAFATIAGLPPIAGIYSAVVMELVSSLLSRSPRLVVGPSITASTLTLAVLVTAVGRDPGQWPAAAGTLAIFVGVVTIISALLDIGRVLRFVSRSVIVGLMVGSAILIVGSQLPGFFGIAASREPMLVRELWHTVANLADARPGDMLMSAGTFGLVLLFGRLGKRFPAAFAALVVSGVAHWALTEWGVDPGMSTIGALPRQWPTTLAPLYAGPFSSDFLIGAAVLSLVSSMQTLTIAKAHADRCGAALSSKRELVAVGLANTAAGCLHGFPGSGSFARSALSELAGARTRLAGVASATTTIVIVLVGAPLTRHITSAAIAGLLLATVASMVDWSELVHVFRRDRHDRVVLGLTIAGVFVVPIHWAIAIGMAASIVMLLRRVSRLFMYEMTRTAEGPFREREVDERTGRSAITMLQVEGPLFYAHAELLSERLHRIFARGPRVTILRMRRTQQIDYTVVTALDRVIQEYVESGGHVVICGLSKEMRDELRDGPIGRRIGGDFLLETTRDVFGSAHLAIGLAQNILDVTPQPDREPFRCERAQDPAASSTLNLKPGA